MTKASRPLAVLATAACLMTACAGPAAPAAQPPVPTTPTAPATTATQTLDEAPVVLPDGRHPVFLSAIDASAKTVTFDLLVFLTGAAATAQAKKDHPPEGDDYALNGYYIVNNNPKLRTLPAAPTVTAKEVDPAAPTPDLLKPVSLAALSTEDGYAHRPFWITVVNGQITLMEEQFLP